MNRDGTSTSTSNIVLLHTFTCMSINVRGSHDLMTTAVQNERPKQRAGALKRHRTASDASDLPLGALGVDGTAGSSANSGAGVNVKPLGFAAGSLHTGVIMPLALPIAPFAGASFQPQLTAAARLSFRPPITSAEHHFDSVPNPLTTDEFQQQQQRNNVAAQWWLQRQMQMDWNGALLGFGQLLRAQQTQLQVLSLSNEPHEQRLTVTERCESESQSLAEKANSASDESRKTEDHSEARLPTRAKHSSGALVNEHLSSDLKPPNNAPAPESASGETSGGVRLEVQKSSESRGRERADVREDGQPTRKRLALSSRQKSASFVSIADILGLHERDNDRNDDELLNSGQQRCCT